MADNDKNIENQNKHHVSFVEAQYAFLDFHRVIFEDVNHSDVEPRFYCLGKNKEGSSIPVIICVFGFGQIKHAPVFLHDAAFFEVINVAIVRTVFKR